MSDFVRQNAIVQNFTRNSWCILNSIERSIKEKIEKIGVPLKDWDIKIYRGILTGCNEAFIIDGATKDALIAQDPKSAEIIRPNKLSCLEFQTICYLFSFWRYFLLFHLYLSSHSVLIFLSQMKVDSSLSQDSHLYCNAYLGT